MSQSEHLPLADVKNRLSEVVERLEREHGRVVVTKHGRPAAVMLSVEDLESLEETLEILSATTALAAVRAGSDDIATGRTEHLSRDEVLARVRARGA
ncbi:MAG: type II toxin-antitoxin system Phd/YefM family antitoxin [Actinomycetota bacterium]|nr:type II toxin-antitoxin system Phd/YefM family antitoxin [Actinomycetota bacterium]